MLVAALVGVLGSAAAVGGAVAVVGAENDRSADAFAAGASEIASTLRLAIQRENDLVADVGAWIVQNHERSTSDLTEWIEASGALERYPELLGVGYIRLVEHDDLAAFAAAQADDPAVPMPEDGTFPVLPPGDRSHYCLLAANVSRTPTSLGGSPDLCFGPSGEFLLAARDAAFSAYAPLAVTPGYSLVAMQAPVYRGGSVPETVEERRAEFLGWSAYLLDPTQMLNRALEGDQGAALEFRFHMDDLGDFSFAAGTRRDDARSMVVAIDDLWSVEIFAGEQDRSVWESTSALALLGTGVAMSILLAVLLLVLATGRARALGIVHEQTGQLRHQALHDALTGLPNRALIHDRIEQMLIRNRRQGTHGAVLFVDLDGFKNVNDTLGHEAGDRLLKAVTSRLTAKLREADTIGRMGGDEFVVLVDGATSSADPQIVASRLIEAMRAPFVVDESLPPIAVTASVGIAVGDRGAPGDLLRDADVALYCAKDAGRNRFELFSDEMDAAIQTRQELEFDLRAATVHEQFRLVYQPIYALDSLQVSGVEALLRWDHPHLGEISPGQFIPILEKSGQIVEVGRWVLDEACRQTAVWHAAGSELAISVNVSARQLDQDTIVDDVRHALDASGLDPRALTIEVTETALMLDVEVAATRLRRLKELGVQIAIDDFGTGYSSLAYLQQLPVDCLKIDRAFTSAIARSAESDALIGTLVQLGKDLGLRTLAEGVETDWQMDHLREHEVDEAQGFLFSRPLTPDAIDQRLHEPVTA